MLEPDRTPNRQLLPFTFTHFHFKPATYSTSLSHFPFHAPTLLPLFIYLTCYIHACTVAFQKRCGFSVSCSPRLISLPLVFPFLLSLSFFFLFFLFIIKPSFQQQKNLRMRAWDSEWRETWVHAQTKHGGNLQARRGKIRKWRKKMFCKCLLREEYEAERSDLFPKVKKNAKKTWQWMCPACCTKRSHKIMCPACAGNKGKELSPSHPPCVCLFHAFHAFAVRKHPKF